MNGENGVHLPIAQHGIHEPICVLPERPMLAQGQVIGDVAVEHMGQIVITVSVVLIDVVGILLEGNVGARLAAGSIAVTAIVTLVVGQAFRPSVIHLKGKPVAEALLRREL